MGNYYGLYREQKNDTAYANSDYEILARYTVNTKNQVVNGNMQGTTDPWADTACTHSFSTDNPYDGTKSLKIVKTGAGDGSVTDAILTNTTDYTLTGFFAGDGTSNVSIQNNSVELAASTTSTAYQSFNVDFTAGATDLTIVIEGGVASNFGYVDNLRIVENADTSTEWTPFAANRSCSAYLMRHIAENENKLAYQTKDVWSTTV